LEVGAGCVPVVFDLSVEVELEVVETEFAFTVVPFAAVVDLPLFAEVAFPPFCAYTAERVMKRATVNLVSVFMGLCFVFSCVRFFKNSAKRNSFYKGS
jgi:hypothetical protein